MYNVKRTKVGKKYWSKTCQSMMEVCEKNIPIIILDGHITEFLTKQRATPKSPKPTKKRGSAVSK